MKGFTVANLICALPHFSMASIHVVFGTLGKSIDKRCMESFVGGSAVLTPQSVELWSSGVLRRQGLSDNFDRN